MNNNHEKHLLYYQREISFLRQMGGLFASKYPKIAKRLNFNEHQSTDPHVERLIESFAYLTSYLQKDIDNQFPRISSALLNILYPHQSTLIPSMSIAHFDAHLESGMTDAYQIEKGSSVFSESETGEVCNFQTCYPVDLWPIEVSDISLERMGKYDFAPQRQDLSKYTYALKISLNCPGDEFLNLDLNNLRFFINFPRAQANTLYQLLFEEDLPMVILGDEGEDPNFIQPGALKQVGFEPEEAVIPRPKNGHPAYGLLQEYFLFQKKFMFVDLTNLNFKNAGNTAEILIPLSGGTEAKSLLWNKRSLLLGCTPIINLFSKTSEPIRLNHQKIEYRLIADHRRELTTEIHSIDKVYTSGIDEVDVIEVTPYFSYDHHTLGTEDNNFWHARQVPSTNQNIPGSDTMISFVDLDMSPSSPAVDIAYARILCTNRQLAPNLPANTLLTEEEGNAPVSAITCLFQPTNPMYPPEEGSSQWQLISQLSLNYLSFSSDEQSLEALKEILFIYAGDEQKNVEEEINSLKSMTCETVLRRMGKDAWRGFVKGTAVTLTVDDGGSSSLGAFLFTSILAHFFGLYTNINSFVELTVRNTRKEGIWKQWPLITGTQKLL